MKRPTLWATIWSTAFDNWDAFLSTGPDEAETYLEPEENDPGEVLRIPGHDEQAALESLVEAVGAWTPYCERISEESLAVLSAYRAYIAARDGKETT